MIFIKIKKPKIVNIIVKVQHLFGSQQLFCSFHFFYSEIQSKISHCIKSQCYLNFLVFNFNLSIVILTITNIFILVIALGIININITFHYQFRINICHFYWNVQNIPLFKIFYLPSCVLYPSYVLYQCILKPPK